MALDRMFRSMASVTKSVLSALTGITVDKGIYTVCQLEDNGVFTGVCFGNT